MLFGLDDICYATSTKIGEWERVKCSRWVLLPRAGERSCGISAWPPSAIACIDLKFGLMGPQA
jgi:hypothetical protein